MLSARDVCGDDARVAGLELFRLLVQIHVGRNELPLVVGASITNHDLGRVLVRHHHCRLWQSTSEGIWMVRLEWLFEHARMEVVPNFELVL